MENSAFDMQIKYIVLKNMCSKTDVKHLKYLLDILNKIQKIYTQKIKAKIYSHF